MVSLRGALNASGRHSFDVTSLGTTSDVSSSGSLPPPPPVGCTGVEESLHGVARDGEVDSNSGDRCCDSSDTWDDAEFSYDEDEEEEEEEDDEDTEDEEETQEEIDEMIEKEVNNVC